MIRLSLGRVAAHAHLQLPIIPGIMAILLPMAMQLGSARITLQYTH